MESFLNRFADIQSTPGITSRSGRILSMLIDPIRRVLFQRRQRLPGRLAFRGYALLIIGPPMDRVPAIGQSHMLGMMGMISPPGNRPVKTATGIVLHRSLWDHSYLSTVH